MGWPGSMTDSFIWQNSHVWKHRATHFQEGEWLLADRGIKSGTILEIELTENANRLSIISIPTPPIQ